MVTTKAYTIQEAIDDVRKGIPVILVDALDRENEGDLVLAAEKATKENLAFIARYARGIMCIPCDGHILDRLDVPAMVQRSTDRLQTPFTVSVDATNGITTGVPVADRLRTIDVLLDPNSKPSDLVRPGHLFPLRPHPMGLRGRQGHTESSIELVRLAGMKPVAVISEIMNDDGTMARDESLLALAEQWDLKIIAIPDIIEYQNRTAAVNNNTAVILSAGSTREDVAYLTGTHCSAMIPVNGKPAIYWNLTYLIDLGITDFLIVSRPEMRHLRSYTDSMFGSVADIRFVDGDPSGGPGDSLLNGLKYVKSPGALIVLGDTVFNFPQDEEQRIQELDDFVLVEDVDDPERWCMVALTAENGVRAFIEKELDAIPNSKALIGVYKISDARLLASRLEEASARCRADRRRTEISDGLASYAAANPMRALEASKWLDLGNPDNLIGSRKKSIVVRAYNSFSFDNVLGTITKRSEDPKLRDEIEYYKRLPSELSALFPRLISSTQAENECAMTLEYYGYPNLGDLLCYGTIGTNVWRRVISKLLAIVKLWSTVQGGPGSREHAIQMYLEKTERENQRFAQQTPEFHDLATCRSVALNGSQFDGLQTIWPHIRSYIMDELLTYRSSVIHGDCCLANILYDTHSENVRFVDPRGSFGAIGVTGDVRYDVAKLYHSFDGGYEFLNNDMFVLEDNGGYYLRLINGENREGPLRLFEELFFDDFDKRQIKTIEGTIYIGMCARHYDNPKRQAAMYLTGVRLLNESLNIL